MVQGTSGKGVCHILANGGILSPDAVPEGFGGFQSSPPPLGTGELLPVLTTNGHANPEYEAWLETNVRKQKQDSYFIATIKVPQGNFTASQMRALADIARKGGDSVLRFGIDQNVMLAWIPQQNLKRVYQSLRLIGLADAGANEIEDVLSCPGAYSCNLALTKSMNLGAALAESVKKHSDPQVRKLKINISGCPNACGQHWIGDLGFYGNARKINGKEVPYYLMLLGGGSDQSGVMRFGFAIQSIAARLAPVAVDRVLEHFVQNRIE